MAKLVLSADGAIIDTCFIDKDRLTIGRGPDNEVWELFEHLPGLMRDCAALLEKSNAMLVLTAYAIRASALAIDQVTREALAGRGGTFASGELAIREEGGQRAVPTSLFTRWWSDDAAL